MTLRNMRANGALAGGHLRRVVVSSLNQRSMPNEHPTGLGTAGKKPPIPVRSTAVNLSELGRHAGVPA
jgi:hypothetical protein